MKDSFISEIGLGIGIKKIIDSHSDYIGIPKGNVFPIVADQAEGDYLVYQKTNGYEVSRTKDGMTQDKMSFTVKVYSESYFDGAWKALTFRNALERLGIDYSGATNDLRLKFKNIRLVGSSEDYAAGHYIQYMQFECDLIIRE